MASFVADCHIKMSQTQEFPSRPIPEGCWEVLISSQEWMCRKYLHLSQWHQRLSTLHSVLVESTGSFAVQCWLFLVASDVEPRTYEACSVLPASVTSCTDLLFQRTLAQCPILRQLWHVAFVAAHFSSLLCCLFPHWPLFFSFPFYFLSLHLPCFHCGFQVVFFCVETAPLGPILTCLLSGSLVLTSSNLPYLSWFVFPPPI